MNTQLLATLVVLVDSHYSFTLAAKKMQIIQPAISKSIKRLEVLVGEDLFVKRGRSYIFLTARGEAVLLMARVIIELVMYPIS